MPGHAYDVTFGHIVALSELQAVFVDGQVLLGPWTIPAVSAGEPVAVEREPGLSCLGLVLRPTSEGSIAITSADPDEAIRVEPNYFTTDHDRKTGADLLRRMRDILSRSPIADRISHETYPGTDVQTDEELVDSAVEGGYCGYHAVGTCAIGPSDDDVVDSKLRVRGVDGLRVVDCSVMPTMVAGNLNGPIMAMASRAVELIRNEQ